VGALWAIIEADHQTQKAGCSPVERVKAMGPLGSLIAGMAVAIAGVAFGRRLERGSQKMRSKVSGGRATSDDAPASNAARPPTLNADVDPETGTFTTRP